MGIGVTPVRTPQCGFVHSKCVWDEARLRQSRVGDGSSQACGDQLGRYEFIHCDIPDSGSLGGPWTSLQGDRGGFLPRKWGSLCVNEP